MTQANRDASAELRWGIYAVLIALAVGNMSGRILAVNSVNRTELETHLIRREVERVTKELKKKGLPAAELEQQLEVSRARITVEKRLQRPFLSANDRSRWLGVRALVEHGTYAIDGLMDRHVWNTIDMVQHRGRDGELHLYSSKPPLLITLLAGEYWLIHQVTGMTLGTHPYEVGRLMLLSVNVLPMVLMFVMLARLADRLGCTDWGRIFTLACATFGTFLTAFAVVLNNHLVGAVSSSIALYAFVRIWCDGETRLRYYVVAGLAAAFTATNELPALALLVLVGMALLLCNRRSWTIAFLPSALLVVIAFFATNYAAHDCLTPPYMHKGTDDPNDDWYVYTYALDGVERQSYWMNRQGIDRGEASKLKYALHVIGGHHGIFSLTPIWLLSLLGIALWLRSADSSRRVIAAGIAALTVVTLVFYIGFRPQVDRNYGGWTSGFRWMFWFAPLWLVTMLPAGDAAAGSRWGKSLALVLLALSVLSASYPTWNPWIQPWIYQWLVHNGWQGF